MRLERGPIPIELARELVEEALDAAARNCDVEVRTAFRDDREAVQSIETIDIREKRLDAFDSHWMEQLQVAAPLESVIARYPGIENVVSGCFLRLARAKEDEAALLSSDGAPRADSAPVKPALVVHVTVATLLARDKLEPLVMSTLAKAHAKSPLGGGSSPAERPRVSKPSPPEEGGSRP